MVKDNADLAKKKCPENLVLFSLKFTRLFLFILIFLPDFFQVDTKMLIVVCSSSEVVFCIL